MVDEESNDDNANLRCVLCYLERSKTQDS